MDDFLRRAMTDQLEFQSAMVKDGSYPAPTYEERTTRTKEMILHLMSEADELLRSAGAWKFHRNVPVPENREQMKVELIDILKYWMIVAHIQGVTVEEIEDMYWTKSMVVRQRWSQEWLLTLDRPSVIVDIDNVLADYIGGFLGWIIEHGPPADGGTARRLIEHRPAYVDHLVLQLPRREYEALVHQFRVSQGHRYFTLMPGVHAFLESIHAQGWQIILLTSRPIHQYPNLYGDTMHWLHLRGLPFDHIWWAQDKGEEVARRLSTEFTMFAVDDDWRYIQQYQQAGIVAIWYRPTQPDETISLVHGEVNSLDQITGLMAAHGKDVRHVSGSGTPAARPPHWGDTGE